MAYGTLPNIANAGHEPTPDARAEQIAHNLLKLPRSHFTVIDGTCGEGNLLAPFQGNAHAELIGIEINGKASRGHSRPAWNRENPFTDRADGAERLLLAVSSTRGGSRG